ncbi:MAG TPA: ATP-binding cassette domain-containing protein [Thermoanaerobaculia bacterium]
MRRSELMSLAWPSNRLSEAISLIAREHGFAAGEQDTCVASADIEALAENAGVEAEKIHVLYRDVDAVLRASAPALIRADDGFLVLLRNRGRRSVIIGPDLAELPIERAHIASALREVVETSRSAALNRLLETVTTGRVELRRRMIAERFGEEEIGECWLIRRSLRESFRRHLADAGVGAYAFALVATHVARWVVFVLAWSVIGRAALEGKPDGAWLIAWLLLLLMLVPIHYVATSMQGLVALACGFVLRQRLLYGSLRLDPEQLRTDGAGRHLARVFEGDAVEVLGRSGGFLALFALIELGMAAFVLANGAGGMLHVTLLAGWILFIIVFTIAFNHVYDDWSSERLSLTGDLVERMVGHRTRLVQEPRGSWHDDEDRQLERYACSSVRLDRSLTWITAVIPRGWIALALIGLAPSIFDGRQSVGVLAISLGGIVLAQQAMKRLATGLPDVIGAVAAWQKVAPLSRAASQPRDRHSVIVSRASDGTVVDAKGIAFRYANRAEPVLRGCTFRVQTGDRIVLEGGSGSGKSTLASILSGARLPDTGLLLLDGFDRATLGSDGWRSRAVLAPQFHENHVLSESFAFNLLMGRNWPPKPEDWREAEELCEELGLGDLLAQMPAGLSQMVGETGWRLSHGEQSRLFIARALLQKSELVVLDESFAALDPETLRQAIDCVLRRAPALVVIAHP